MPYSGYMLGMVVILPRRNDGLPELERRLTSTELHHWIDGMQIWDVRVTLPKFRIEGQFSLADHLQAMGMTDAFAWKKADFTGMAADKEICISDILHKSFVDVDEQGTEAAAATAVIEVAGAPPPAEEPKVFKADHPFLFLIRHRKTGEVLFLGRLVEPARE